MFQYVCWSQIIRLHSMHGAPAAVEEWRLLPTFGDFVSTTALFSRILPTSSRILPTVVYVCRILPTSVYLRRPRACSCFTSVQGGAICTAARKEVSMQKDYRQPGRTSRRCTQEKGRAHSISPSRDRSSAELSAKP